MTTMTTFSPLAACTVYSCVVTRVIDGDTVEVDIDVGFGLWLQQQRVRLWGIDCPETRTTNLQEKERGLAAKQFVQDIMHQHGAHPFLLEIKGKDNFGRWLACFYYYTDGSGDLQGDWRQLNQVLLDTGHAVERLYSS